MQRRLNVLSSTLRRKSKLFIVPIRFCYWNGSDPAQNLNCTSICMRRGGFAATGLPKNGEEMVPM